MNKEKFTLSNISMKVQKIIILIAFFTFIAMFAYCLMFFTPYYELSKINTIWSSGLKASELAQKFGIDIASLPEDVYTQHKISGKITLDLSYFTAIAQSSTSQHGAGVTIQAFNKFLFNFSLIGIGISCLLFIYRSQLRKKYYVTNYVVHGIYSVYAMVIAIITLGKLSYWQTKTKEINYDLINGYLESQESSIRLSPTDADWMYVLGRILCIVMIIISILLVALSIYKFISQIKYEKEKALVMKGEQQNGENI